MDIIFFTLIFFEYAPFSVVIKLSTWNNNCLNGKFDVKYNGVFEKVGVIVYEHSGGKMA